MVTLQIGVNAEKVTLQIRVNAEKVTSHVGSEILHIGGYLTNRR